MMGDLDVGGGLRHHDVAPSSPEGPAVDVSVANTSFRTGWTCLTCGHRTSSSTPKPDCCDTPLTARVRVLKSVAQVLRERRAGRAS